MRGQMSDIDEHARFAAETCARVAQMRQDFEALKAQWALPDLSKRAKPAMRAKPDLAKLRAEMVVAHPDRGGTNEAFIAAHQRYVRAKARC